MPSLRHCVSYIWRFRSLSLLIHCGRSRALSLITGSGIEKRLWSSKVRLYVRVGVRGGGRVKSVRGLTVSWAGALNCLFYHKRTLLSMLVRRFSWNAPPDMPSTRIKSQGWCLLCSGRIVVMPVAEGEQRVRGCGSVTVRVLVLECECESARLVWECERGSSLECGSISAGVY